MTKELMESFQDNLGSLLNKAVMEHVDLTLKRMAYGGIYDQIGGGFEGNHCKRWCLRKLLKMWLVLQKEFGRLALFDNTDGNAAANRIS